MGPGTILVCSRTFGAALKNVSSVSIDGFDWKGLLMDVAHMLSNPGPEEIHKRYLRRLQMFLTEPNRGGGVEILKKQQFAAFSLDLAYKTYFDFIVAVTGKMAVMQHDMKSSNDRDASRVDEVLKNIQAQIAELHSLPPEQRKVRAESIALHLDLVRSMLGLQNTTASIREFSWDSVNWLVGSVHLSLVELLNKGDEAVARALMGVIIRTFVGMVPWVGPLLLGIEEIKEALATQEDRIATASTVEAELDAYSAFYHHWAMLVETLAQALDATASTTQDSLLQAAETVLKKRSQDIIEKYGKDFDGGTSPS